MGQKNVSSSESEELKVLRQIRYQMRSVKTAADVFLILLLLGIIGAVLSLCLGASIIGG